MVTSTVTIAASGIVAYLIGSLIYNLVFHPLAAFPGPLKWRASRIPFIISLVSGRLPHDYRKFHDQYGPIVRVAPTELSFIDPGAWKDIYTKSHYIRPWIWRGKPPGVKADSLISATEADHARFRKILGPAFSEQAVQRQEPIIQQYVDLFVHKLEEKVAASSKKETTLNIIEWFNYTTFDIIGDLGWGSSFECLESQKISGWIQVVLHFKAVVFAVVPKYFPPLDTILDLITPQSALEGINMVVETAREKVSRRLPIKTDRPDMITHIAAAREQGLNMTDEEITLNSFAVIVAGSESVTTILTAIIGYLLSNSTAYEKLTKEIRSSFANGEEITGTATKHLPYLNAVLKEGMRIAPSVPDGSRRDIPAGEVALIAGHSISGPATVAVPQWSAYMSFRNFTNPQSFAPERWLPGSGDIYRNDVKSIFQPFGCGAHNCLGQPLAWLEMQLMLARLLFAFDLSWPDADAAQFKWSLQSIYWTWEKQPLNVRLVVRDKSRRGGSEG